VSSFQASFVRETGARLKALGIVPGAGADHLCGGANARKAETWSFNLSGERMQFVKTVKKIFLQLTTLVK
jgi:hypothetical protein